MKKAFLLLAAGLFFMGASYAQYERPIGSEFSVGVTGALPVGDFGDYSSFGLGIDAKYAYNFSEAIAATASAGYTNFFGKDDADNSGFIPLKAGIRFSMGALYAEPQIGAAIGTGEGSTTLLDYAGQIGFMASSNLDLSLRYEGLSKNSVTSSFIGLRVAYTMPF